MTISLAPRAYGSYAAISAPADFSSGLTKGPEKQEQQQTTNHFAASLSQAALNGILARGNSLGYVLRAYCGCSVCVLCRLASCW